MKDENKIQEQMIDDLAKRQQENIELKIADQSAALSISSGQDRCRFAEALAGEKPAQSSREMHPTIHELLKLDALQFQNQNISEVELSEILDLPAVQSIMEDYYGLANIAMALTDINGNIIVSIGWQDICTQFHRIHPQTALNCTESDLYLTGNLQAGQYVSYKCKNQMWDVVTPLFIGGKHLGNIFAGQFFYEDEAIDEGVFLEQALQYGFDQESYLQALRRVPRHSHKRVRKLMDFLVKFSKLISQLGYSNLKLAQAIAEQKRIGTVLQDAYEEMEATLEELTATEEELRNQYQLLQEKEHDLRESEQRLTDIINFLPDPTLVIDKAGQVVLWNQGMEEMSGVAREQIIGRGNYEYALPFYGERRPMLIDLALMSEREYDEVKGKYDFVRQQDNNFLAEVYVPKTYGGKGAYLWGSASRLYDMHGNTVGAIESMRDITERKEMEKTITDEAEFRKITLLSIGDGVISTDAQGGVKTINRVAEQLCGWTQEEAFGKSLEEVFHIVNQLTRERCENPVKVVLDTGKTIEMGNHTLLISKTGMATPIEDSVAPIKDESGNTNGVVLVFRDFTEKKERQEKIAYLSYYDQLTGLYNRRFYEEELKRLDTERNLPLTLIMGDINGLKLSNDAFGHLAGDKLLQKAAEVMKKECRVDDIIARIGGDEFVILLPKTEAEEALIIVQRINEALLHTQADSLPLSISFGWETKRSTTEEMTLVFKQAEDHMYRRKLSESASMRNWTIKLIIKTLYEKNAREEQHSTRVSKLCETIGIALKLSPEDIKELRTVGLMHDIGKITLDAGILDKPTTLSDYEMMEIKRHPEIGYHILSSVNEFSHLAEYVLAHHERWDGRGYPKGLKGLEIPFEARIIAVADAYDAMTSDRPYRKALSENIVIREIKKNAGVQFDPAVAKLFLEKVLGQAW